MAKVNPYDSSGLSAQNGIYRAAFPAARVFIYGREVTGDIIDVRVNQSGGSMDRSPSTCSFTLANIGDKYIVDHDDMIALSAGRAELVGRLEERIEAYKGSVGLDGRYAGQDVSVMSEMLELLSTDSRYSELVTYTEALYEKLRGGALGFDEGYWDEFSVPDNMKLSVIKEKAPQIVENSEELVQHLSNIDSPLTRIDYSGGDKVIYKYPFTEGDCIFHPNDPIRIAFRDPFKPTMWYWMFAGFLDSFTEDVGVNQESTVTIAATDVSKSLRYSYFQLRVDAGRDPVLAEVLAIAGVESDSGQLNWTGYENIFAHFTIFEILELLFFGLDVYKNSATQLSVQAMARMSEDEVDTYLLKVSSGLSTEDLKDMFPDAKRDEAKEYLLDKKVNRFQGSHFPPVYHPRGVTFKPSESTLGYGTRAFFVGDEPDVLDLSIGDKVGMSDLGRLNDKYYHQVSVDDLSNMLLSGETPAESSGLGIVDVIGIIGKDTTNYPVGGGRVFYVAPSGLSMGLAAGVFDEAINSNNSDLHSTFKDRLTFLYDLADKINFCFYATARGDLVFEMPFFDFNPWDFDYDDTFIGNEQMDADVAKYHADFESMRMLTEDFVAGSSKYTEDDIYSMMELSLDLQLTREGFSLQELSLHSEFLYSDHFTINKHETLGFSNSLDDNGLKTFSRTLPRNVARVESLDDSNTRDYEWAVAPGLMSMLGARPAADVGPWSEITSAEGAQFFAAVELRKANAEARNVGLQVLPQFGLMVNRPLYWRQRNYVANVVSCQHSMSINSSCDTAINLNYVKGWTGKRLAGTDSRELFEYFGGEQPFDYSVLLGMEKKGK